MIKLDISCPLLILPLEPARFLDMTSRLTRLLPCDWPLQRKDHSSGLINSPAQMLMTPHGTEQRKISEFAYASVNMDG